MDSQGTVFLYLAFARNYSLKHPDQLLGPTQLPIRWVLGALSHVGKVAWAWRLSLNPCSAKVKNEWVKLYLHSPHMPPWCVQGQLCFTFQKRPWIASTVAPENWYMCCQHQWNMSNCYMSWFSSLCNWSPNWQGMIIIKVYTHNARIFNYSSWIYV